MWESTDGAQELLQEYIKKNGLPLPDVDISPVSSASKSSASSTSTSSKKSATAEAEEEDVDDHVVLAQMFMTAVNMLLEESD